MANPETKSLPIWGRSVDALREVGIESLVDRNHQPRICPNPRKPDLKLLDSEPDTAILPLDQWPKDLILALEKLLRVCERLDKDTSTAKAFLHYAIIKRKSGAKKISKVREVIANDANSAVKSLVDESARERKRKCNAEEEEGSYHAKRPQRVERMLTRTTLADNAPDVAVPEAAQAAADHSIDHQSDTDTPGSETCPARLPASIFANASEISVVAVDEVPNQYEPWDPEGDSLGTDYEADDSSEDDAHQKYKGAAHCEDDLYVDDRGGDSCSEGSEHEEDVDYEGQSEEGEDEEGEGEDEDDKADEEVPKAGGGGPFGEEGSQDEGG